MTDEFGIDVDAIVQSIKTFKEDYLKDEWDIDLYNCLMEVLKDDHARMKFWVMMRTASFNDDISLPITSYEKLSSLKNFFHMLTYHLFDDGQLFLVRIKSGFPARCYVSDDYKQASVNDRETVFITDVDMSYESNAGKFIKMLENDGGFGAEICYPKSYCLEYISLSIVDFKNILKKILEQSRIYRKKYDEWDNDRENKEFPIEYDTYLDFMFEKQADDVDDNEEPRTVYYSKD